MSLTCSLCCPIPLLSAWQSPDPLYRVTSLLCSQSPNRLQLRVNSSTARPARPYLTCAQPPLCHHPFLRNYCCCHFSPAVLALLPFRTHRSLVLPQDFCTCSFLCPGRVLPEIAPCTAPSLHADLCLDVILSRRGLPCHPKVKQLLPTLTFYLPHGASSILVTLATICCIKYLWIYYLPSSTTHCGGGDWVLFMDDPSTWHMRATC